tara:strand:+ start:1570 stop:1764 length:195 start_codon:yes stop_codon:yes gene_type:complete
VRLYLTGVIFALALSGCFSPSVHLHPIETVDIIAVPKGESITAPKDGFFLSKEYVSHVMEAKVQ